MKLWIPTVAIGGLLIFSVFYFNYKNDDNPGETVTPSGTAISSKINEPLSNAMARITKKAFGIKVSPSDSPVQPEKFAGYHTGVDFEVTEAEQNAEINVYAICDGPLLSKRTATGYGGVAVQSCVLDGQAVTVVYGHIKLSSVGAGIGEVLSPGEKLAVLGAGYSTETDGERKHLHLGIHKGSAVNIVGYVQNQEQLKQWLNAADYLH